MEKLNNFSSKKSEKMNEIQEDYHRRIENKMKKIYSSADFIKKLEEQRINNIEERKLEKYEVVSSNKNKLNEELNSKKLKEKKRFEEVQYNLKELIKETEKKNNELSGKLKKKYHSNIKSFENINGNLIHNLKDENSISQKRQINVERFMFNCSEIKKNNQNRNLKLLKMQQERVERSFDKLRSLDMSKENAR
jgi:hypothetical protein